MARKLINAFLVFSTQLLLSGIGITASGGSIDRFEQCTQCYEDGKMTCTDEIFDKAACCDPSNSEEMTNCYDDYKYCSKNLKEDAYKKLSCPMTSCAGREEATKYNH